MDADQPPAPMAGNETPALSSGAPIVGSHIPDKAALAGNTMLPCRWVPGLPHVPTVRPVRSVWTCLVPQRVPDPGLPPAAGG
jgi:hypothetical protein